MVVEVEHRMRVREVAQGPRRAELVERRVPRAHDAPHVPVDVGRNWGRRAATLHRSAFAESGESCSLAAKKSAYCHFSAATSHAYMSFVRRAK